MKFAPYAFIMLRSGIKLCMLKINHLMIFICHAKALDFWEQEYNQLSEVEFQSRLQDLSFNGLRIFREKMNCRVAQCTKTPPDTVNILIPIHLVPEKDHLPTHSLYTHGATLLPSEYEFFFCTPPDTDYIVISLHQDLLEKRLIQQDLQKILKNALAVEFFSITRSQHSSSSNVPIFWINIPNLVCYQLLQCSSSYVMKLPIWSCIILMSKRKS